MTLKKAVQVLGEALRTDEGYSIGWRANIAMACYDECSRRGIKHVDLHAALNSGAHDFIKRLACEIEPSDDPDVADKKDLAKTSDPTKRELFAAMAMQGLIIEGCGEIESKKAVEIADALIEELEKPRE